MKNVTLTPAGPRAAKGSEDGTGGQFLPNTPETWAAWLCQQLGALQQAQAVEEQKRARGQFGAVIHGADGGGAVSRKQPATRSQAGAWFD